MMVTWDFFFFKQKTAYEMRISDWSSDVCSSDLLLRRKHPIRSFSRSAAPGIDRADRMGAQGRRHPRAQLQTASTDGLARRSRDGLHLLRPRQPAEAMDTVARRD